MILLNHAPFQNRDCSKSLLPFKSSHFCMERMLGHCFVLWFLVSSLAWFSNHLVKEERAGCFSLIMLWRSGLHRVFLNRYCLQTEIMALLGHAHLLFSKKDWSTYCCCRYTCWSWVNRECTGAKVIIGLLIVRASIGEFMQCMYPSEF